MSTINSTARPKVTFVPATVHTLNEIQDHSEPPSISSPLYYDGIGFNPIESALAATEDGPNRLFLRDAGTLFYNLKFVFDILRPRSSGGMPTKEDIIDSCIIGITILLELVMIVAIPISAFVLPGIVALAITLFSCCLIYIICLPMNKPWIKDGRIMKSNCKNLPKNKKFLNEQWVFANGICSGRNGVQQNVDMLTKIFGRPVWAVHNRTYGLIFDVLECLVQRCFSYATQDSRILFQVLKRLLVDPSMHKVVVIAHSQGGILTSMVLDRLLDELPMVCVGKLEIYTFGSAAGHFNNPQKRLCTMNTVVNNGINVETGEQEQDIDGGDVLSWRASPEVPGDRVIRHIEHYANEKDMVPRWGVLAGKIQASQHHRSTSRSTQDSNTDLPEYIYCGQLFIRNGASGHLFEPHYLKFMFPLDEENTFIDTVTSETLPETLQPLSVTSNIPVEGGDTDVKTVKMRSRLWEYCDGQDPPPSPLATRQSTFTGDLNGSATYETMVASG